DTQHTLQVLSALEDHARSVHDAEFPLLTCKLGAFYDLEHRRFARSPEDGEKRLVAQVIDGVIPPFSGSDHETVKTEDLVQLASTECYRQFKLFLAEIGQLHQFLRTRPIVPTACKICHRVQCPR